MKRFTQLYTGLDQTSRADEKMAALTSYFRQAPPADAAWGLHFLYGRKLPRLLTAADLRAWAAEEAGLPLWLVDECCQAVGDLAETAALLLPKNESHLALSLSQLVEQRLLPMRARPESAKSLLLQTWREMSAEERFVWNKLVTGGLRGSVAQALVGRALAAVAGIDYPVMTHRLMGRWEPTTADFCRLIGGCEPHRPDPAQPYPFFLASTLDHAPAGLGDLAEWQIEWKWDGLRAQLIRRQDLVLLWSRGEEMVTETFPEIAAAGRALPEGTVLDGEVAAWKGEQPQPFASVQRRLGRRKVSAKMQAEAPVAFLAFDLLEWAGEDWRPRPLTERRRQLEIALAEAARRPLAWEGQASPRPAQTLELFEQFASPPPFELLLRLSPLIRPATWKELTGWQRASRERQADGLMLKRLSSAYGVGRPRGDWWKWKADPLVMDAVLINAQLGHGQLAHLYTDYTFGAWHEGKLVPVAKASAGLTEEEVLEIDAFVRANTIARFGPVHGVQPGLVFELAFESVQESTRHKAGLALRFPRLRRWRRDKQPEEADTLESLRALVKKGKRS